MLTKNRLTIVGFGDSITAAGEVAEEKRWIAIVGEQLQQRLPDCSISAVNAGVGGNTSREGLARIEQSVLAHQPDMVLVEFGGNDATDDMARHVPLEEFTANLAAIEARICAVGATMVLLTFPPVINEWHNWRDHPCHLPYGGADEHVEIYRQRTRAFAAEHGLPLIDIDHVLRDACLRDGNAQYLMPDGVHLTECGNQVVAATVVSALDDVICCHDVKAAD